MTVDQVIYSIKEVVRHVPIVTSIGLSLAVVLALMYVTKKWREAALLSGVCVAYALTPWMPTWMF